MKIKNKKFEIEFIGDTQLKKFLRDSKDRLKKLSEYFQILHQNEDQTMITIKIVSNEEIKILNKEFRKKNKSTDVLSFPFHEKIILNSLIRKDKNKIYLGDIIVNLAKVKNKNNIDKFKIEFDKLWLHGLAHLMGHTHKTNKDFKNMQKFEKILFEAIK